MAVDQDGWLIRRPQPLGVNEGMPGRFDEIGCQSHRRQVVAHEYRGAARIRVVVRLRADAGNPDQGFELFFEFVLSRCEVSLDSIDAP